MPADMILPKDGATLGVWKAHGDGDVHVYLGQHHGVVIGQNKSYKDKVEFSDLALVVAPDGKITFQYADEHGKCHHAAVSDTVWKEIILAMLEKIKTMGVTVTEIVE